MLMNTSNYERPINQHETFIGRRVLVNKIYARIGAGRPQSVSIVGDYKIGKSSLLWYLSHDNTKKAMLNEPDKYIFVSISCQALEPLTLKSLTSRIYQLSKKYITDSTEKETESVSYNYLKKMVESLHTQNKKIIFFFDDFNHVTQNPAFPLEFFSFLRSLANNYNLAYVTTSYEDLQKLVISKDIGESPFFNIFTNMSLRGFEPEEINALLNLYNNNGNANCSDYKEKIIDLAGTAPYALKMACTLLQQMKNDGGLTDQESFNRLETVLFENLKEYHQNLWQGLEESYHDILYLLASGKQVQGAREYLLRDLSKKSYILTTNGKSKIASRVLQNFVLQIKGTGDDKTGLSDRIRHLWNRLFGGKTKI